MVSVYTEENCCGLLVLGNFPYDTDLKKTKEQIKKEIVDSIIEYEGENFCFEYKPFYGMIIATTNGHQTKAGEALKSLGFRSCKFDSRHDDPGNEELTFWKRNKLPKEVLTKLREEFKQYKKDTYDNW